MLKRVIPVLRVGTAAGAEAYYCGKLGFARTFAHCPKGEGADPCYMGVVRDGVPLHLTSFPGDGQRAGVVTFIVDDMDALHAELKGRGVPIALEPTEQDWGDREMYLKDPDGNSIRFQEEREQ